MKTALWDNKLVGLLMVALMVGGCPSMKIPNPLAKRVVDVTVTDAIRNKSVEVHLVGLNMNQIERWDAVYMEEYWNKGNEHPLRKDAKDYTQVFRFGIRQPYKQVLDKTNPIRAKWRKRGVKYIYILANLPGTFDDKHGIADARRSRIPALGSECWPFLEGRINISIGSGDIVCLTPHKCE
jgi:hypothetical protein